MEGKTTGTVMQPLTQADLAGPLSRAVKEKHPRIDLVVAVVDKSKKQECLEIGIPLASHLGQDLKDVCCVFLHQIASDKWRILTTHGSAQVSVAGQHLEINICCNHQSPQETLVLRQLVNIRNELLSQSLGLDRIIEISYPEIQDNVLLCGDFSLWEPFGLLALRKIFTANGARSVVFATPVIGSRRCQRLEEEGCDIVRLHPPEGSRA